MNVRDCYRILQVSKDASMDEIKASYRKLAFKLHPDLNPSPDAADKFREINEAYVILKDAQAQNGGAQERQKERASTTRRPDPKTSAKQGANAYKKQQRATGPSKPKDPASESTRSKSQGFYYREEDVLKDLLNDPFARKVFEDIYSQVRKANPNATGPVKLSRKKLGLSLGSKSFNLDITDGVFGGMKKWFKHQMDDEQTLYFPSTVLMPGRKLRITVHQTFSKGPKTVEVTLPADFVPGKPIRLKGLGRRIGGLRGDLIVRILPKEAMPSQP